MRIPAPPFRPLFVLTLVAVGLLPLSAVAQQPYQRGPHPPMGRQTVAMRPVYKLMHEGEHPVMPALRWAQANVQRIENIRDYSAMFAKRERVDGQLKPYEYMRVKVRHRPFSVYVRFESPKEQRGQEAIYVEGRNQGKLVAHAVGWKAAFGTQHLDPEQARRISGSRHPITKIGILNLARQLITVGENDCKYGECQVKFIHGVKINDRSCTRMEFVHPVPRREFLYHVARVYIDDELNVPIRFEAYTWPKRQGGKPVLIGEYTYMDVKLNNGFTDLDFDPRNPRYGYK